MTDPAALPLPLPFPQYVRHADARANLRCVGRDLYVGGATAILERAAPHRAWWAAVDLHGARHGESFRREPAFGDLSRFLRASFDDGMPVPEGVLDAVVAFVRHRAGPVLITCAAGVSRSATVAYAVTRAELGVGHDVALAMCSCSGGRPLPVTLRSAQRWAEARPLAGRAACYECLGIGYIRAEAGVAPCGVCNGSGVVE